MTSTEFAKEVAENRICLHLPPIHFRRGHGLKLKWEEEAFGKRGRTLTLCFFLQSPHLCAYLRSAIVEERGLLLCRKQKEGYFKAIIATASLTPPGADGMPLLGEFGEVRRRDYAARTAGNSLEFIKAKNAWLWDKSLVLKEWKTPHFFLTRQLKEKFQELKEAMMKQQTMESKLAELRKVIERETLVSLALIS